jgi:hypothetical protein
MKEEQNSLVVKAYLNDLYLKLLEEQDEEHIKNYLNELYEKVVIPNTPRDEIKS